VAATFEQAILGLALAQVAASSRSMPRAMRSDRHDSPSDLPRSLPTPSGATSLRLALGGVLMGLANLVPGISGGTMLVAAGVYRRFIEAISDLSRLRLRLGPLLTVAIVAGAAVVSIAIFASVVSEALLRARWAMYAAFIGLTLGGVPVIWRLLRPASIGTWVGAAVGAVGMIAITWAQSGDVSGDRAGGAWMLLLGGAAGAAAMILPGVSGAYLLLLLGQYRPILEAIRSGASAAAAGEWGAAVGAGFTLAPVAVGVVIGLVAVSNLLRWLLRRYEKVTLGVLLGLLIGAPAGLYPFKEGVAPQAGETFRGEVLDEAAVARLLEKPKDWPERSFSPSPVQVGGSIGLVLAGFAITLGVARLGRAKEPEPSMA
jgi:putative membrane protein